MRFPLPSKTYPRSWKATIEIFNDLASSTTDSLKYGQVEAAQVYATLAQAYATLAAALTADEKLHWDQGVYVSDMKNPQKKKHKKKRSTGK
jgi:hypothetical protein